MARAKLPTTVDALTEQQRQAVRDVAAGRIQRYGLPGAWQVYLENQTLVFQDYATGRTARVSI